MLPDHSPAKLPIHLGIMSNGDPRNVRTWSGVPFAILRRLEPMVESITYLPATPVSKGRTRQEKIRKGLAIALGRRDLPQLDRGHLARRVETISEAARRESVDAILAITVDQFVAHLQTDVPIVHHSDTTFMGYENAYPEATRLWRSTNRRGHEICWLALQRAAHSTYPSRWAANHAIEHYGGCPDQISVIPYGCNLDNPPTREEALSRTTDGKTCRLLFIGRDWERKGGPLVLDTLRELRNRGIDASLSVVGTTPPENDLPVTTIGFLNKQVPADIELYRSLWQNATFLFMPSLAETFGAIYAEAAANGVPALALEVGGVGDAVSDDDSGILFQPGVDAQACADRIIQLMQTPDDYHRLVQGARSRYENVLNWEAWCSRTMDIIESLINRNGKGTDS